MRKLFVAGLCLTGAMLSLADSASAQEITTSPQPPKAEETIVTGSKVAIPLSSAVQAFTIISREDLERSGGRTVAEVIEKTVGITFANYGDRSQPKTISIRASSSEQVLVLIDGRRVSDPVSGFYDLSSIPLDNVERIEIVRGTGSAVYGADAMAGVINIITKKTGEKKLLTLNASSGSYGTLLSSLTFYQKYSALSMVGSAVREESDGFRENAFLDSKDYMFKVDAAVTDKSALNLSYNQFEKYAGSPGLAGTYDFFTGGFVEYEDSQKASSPDNWSKELKRRSALDYRFEAGPFNFMVKTYYNDYEYRYWQDASDPSVWWGYGKLSKHLDTEKAGEVIGEIKTFNGAHIMFGYETIIDDVDSSDVGKHDATRSSVYSQYITKPSQGSTMVFGARYDDHSVYGAEFSPKFGWSFETEPGKIIHVSAGKGYRAPNFSDLYWPNDGMTAGNENLKPEEMVEYEVGLTRTSDGRKLELNVFYRVADNLILWSETSPWFWQPVNIAGAEIQGAEMQTSFQLSSVIKADINYAFTESTDRDTGEHIMYKPKHTVNLLLTAEMPMETGLFVDARWVDNYVPVSENGELWSDYITVNAKLAKKFAMTNAKGEVFVSVENLLDDEIMNKKEYPMPGRNFLFGIQLEF